VSNADRTVLAGARLVLPTGVVENGKIAVENGVITEIAAPVAPPDGAVAALDLTGYTVVPGFVDMHVHGGGGESYHSGTAEQVIAAANAHLHHGTTTTIASTVTGEIDDLCRQAALLSELVEDGVLAGIHFEGPFISNSRCGAHDPALLRDPDPAMVRKLIDAARGTARMLTLAPELEGGIESIRLLAERGVIAAIGHTDASYDKTRAGIDAGATVATHLFNAMPGLAHRAPGPVAALLEDERVTVELIGDGVHLHPAVVDLAFRGAGVDRVALVTDAMDAAGFGDGDYMLGPLAVKVRDGVARLAEGNSIAGSTLTLDVAFKRAVTVNGLPLDTVSRMLSHNPAQRLGLSDRLGSLEVGKRADLVVLDEQLDVVAVMRQGRWAVGVDQLKNRVPVAN
jgi:N-acetylglucosamine-6-phosphate deacetylase